mmetsp:Transcript_7038/g.16087  ORF Transcript_7038/g.16087 Transcript_7038/m.16087 type:complete len:209 (-) Transcript_7038:771-1397(-)
MRATVSAGTPCKLRDAHAARSAFDSSGDPEREISTRRTLAPARDASCSYRLYSHRFVLVLSTSTTGWAPEREHRNACLKSPKHLSWAFSSKEASKLYSPVAGSIKNASAEQTKTGLPASCAAFAILAATVDFPDPDMPLIITAVCLDVEIAISSLTIFAIVASCRFSTRIEVVGFSGIEGGFKYAGASAMIRFKIPSPAPEGSAENRS